MKIRIKGEMSITELIQAIYEQLREMEELYRVSYTRDVVIFLTPTDGEGEEVSCRNRRGKEVVSLQCDGPYKSVADKFRF